MEISDIMSEYINYAKYHAMQVVGIIRGGVLKVETRQTSRREIDLLIYCDTRKTALDLCKEFKGDIHEHYPHKESDSYHFHPRAHQLIEHNRMMWNVHFIYGEPVNGDDFEFIHQDRNSQNSNGVNTEAVEDIKSIYIYDQHNNTYSELAEDRWQA